MNLEARYKIGKEVLGPRPYDEVRRDIKLGALAPDTPLQLTTDGLWTTLEGAEKKLDRFKKPSAIRSTPSMFAMLNVITTSVGYFVPWICLLVAAGLYLAGVVMKYFEEGRQSPGWAFTRLVTMLFPFFGIHVVGGSPSSPLIRWTYASAFVQFAMFCVFVHFGR